MTEVKTKEPPFNASAYQRANWLFNIVNDRRYRKGEKKHTSSQFYDMLGTFISTKDREIYRKLQVVDDKISVAIQSLNQVRLVYLNLISQLEGFAKYMLFINETANTLTEVTRCVTDESDKKAVLKLIKGKNNFTITNNIVVPDLEKIRNVKTSNQTFLEMVRDVNKNARFQLNELHTFIQVVNDYSKKHRYNVSSNKEMINGFLKYCIKETPAQNDTVNYILGFDLYPKTNEIITMPERYKFYKNTILGDED
jgi:hypothetical protein